VVVKLGGRALEAPGALREFASALARLSRVALLVHGGGAEVSAWCDQFGVVPKFESGLRVTDAATLEVATAVLAGLANKRLVAALRAHGVDAVGLAALDGGIVQARPHPRSNVLGAVGEVVAVDAALLDALLAQRRTPVVASIAASPAGELLNVNADDVAAALAGALGASELVLLSDTPGVKLRGAFVAQLDAAGLEAALASPDVAGGMIPKLRAASAALAKGAGRVHIAAWSGPETLSALLERGIGGTTIAAAATPSAASGAVAPEKENVHA
jgi:acetylglutamate kinase